MSEGEILNANTPGPDQLRQGMDVFGADGELIGHVKEVRGQDFLVDRPVARDVYVPYSFVVDLPDRTESLGGGSVVRLSISSSHVDQQHWPHP
jgi:hypothetical protein